MKTSKELYKLLDYALEQESSADKYGTYEDWREARNVVYQLENELHEVVEKEMQELNS